MSETISFDREDSLTAAQREIAEVLRADTGLADVAIIDSAAGAVTTDVQEALAVFAGRNSKVGACVIVKPLEATANYREIGDGPLQLTVPIHVLESVKANMATGGTGKSALWIATRIYRVLHLYQPYGLVSAIVAATPVIKALQQPPGGADIGYEVAFEFQEAGADNDQRVALPAVSVVDGEPDTYVLTCATNGAAIYYTTDGSHPWSGNEEATLYTEPVPVTGITRLRARAFKSGMIGSDTQHLTTS